MINVVSKQYGLPEPWSWNPPAGIRLIDVRTIEELDKYAPEWDELYSKAGTLTPICPPARDRVNEISSLRT
jgi:hypothetical protein